MKAFTLPFGRYRLGVMWEKDGALWVPGGIRMRTQLWADLISGGRRVARYDLGSGVVTTQGVTMIAQAMANSNPTYIYGMNLHDSSTGTAAAAVGDTALAVAPGTAVGSRPAGTQSATSSGTNYIYQTVAVQSYTGSLAITEWGLFRLTRAAGGTPPGSDTLFDRKVFAAINVGSGDSIQFTYQNTITSGG